MAVDGKKLRAYVERYQNLEADKKTAAEDQAQLLSDMEEKDWIEKKPFKALIKYLKDEDEARHQQQKFDDLLAVYLNFETTPLGRHMAKATGDTKLVTEGNKLIDKMSEKITVQVGDGPAITGTVSDIKAAIKTVKGKAEPKPETVN